MDTKMNNLLKCIAQCAAYQPLGDDKYAAQAGEVLYKGGYLDRHVAYNDSLGAVWSYTITEKGIHSLPYEPTVCKQLKQDLYQIKALFRDLRVHFEDAEHFGIELYFRSSTDPELMYNATFPCGTTNLELHEGLERFIKKHELHGDKSERFEVIDSLTQKTYPVVRGRASYLYCRIGADRKYLGDGCDG